jgi:hypothetical protein
MKKDNNSNQIFSLALGLTEPWFLESAELVEVAGNPFQELHIHINFHKGSEFITEDGHRSKSYDTEVKTWRHLDFFSINAISMPEFPESNYQMAKSVSYQFLGQGRVRVFLFYLRHFRCFC